MRPQYPTAFEFNSLFLCDLADHVYSGWFGTFMFNNELERRKHALSLRSVSVWAMLHVNKAKCVVGCGSRHRSCFVTFTLCAVVPIARCCF